MFCAGTVDKVYLDQNFLPVVSLWVQRICSVYRLKLCLSLHGIGLRIIWSNGVV